MGIMKTFFIIYGILCIIGLILLAIDAYNAPLYDEETGKWYDRKGQRKYFKQKKL